MQMPDTKFCLSKTLDNVKLLYSLLHTEKLPMHSNAAVPSVSSVLTALVSQYLLVAPQLLEKCVATCQMLQEKLVVRF